MRHHVTKLLKDAGHCGCCRIVSIAWGAICSLVSAKFRETFGELAYLGKGEAQLLSQAGPFSPFTSSNFVTLFGIPVPGASHYLTNPPHLIDFVAAWE